MTEIKLTKRYPQSKTEDIVDAYMRGWNDALDAVQNGKFIINDDRKTVPTISKMEQVDKDINVRSKDEPQTEEHCETCRHKDKCEGATYEYKNTEWWCLGYAPIDEPQIYVINPQEPTNDDKCFECDDFFTCGGQCNKIEDEQQTDCAWK